MKKLLLPAILLTTLSASSQLVIDNATFSIDDGAVVTIQGDVTSNVDIVANGTGKIRLGGTGAQNINMGGKAIPNLQIDNATGPVTLTSAAKVTTSLDFTNGKIQLGNFDLTIAAAASVTGAGAGKFAETNGTGFVKKELTAAGSTTIPVGNGSTYTPLDYVVTGGTYAAGSYVAARSVAAEHPNKHIRSTDYLKNYWKLNNNISGATLSATGTYVDPTSVQGSEAQVRSMVWNGTTWALGTSQDAAANKITASGAANTDLYGMNKFILSAPKVFLQGAYDADNNIMTDRLRSTASYVSGQSPVNNVIPLKDPYRSAPYSSVFAHVNNDVAEEINISVLNDQPSVNNNIVDWIFVELRTNATPSTVVQTRSALLQKDGDVVDIDGVSPLYFKNVDASNYNISIRHRNHLAVRTATPPALNLTTPLSKIDYTTSAANNLNNFAATIKSGVYGMYAGNGNLNSNVRITGATTTVSDYLYLSSVLGSSISLSNQYSPADYNMNRTVRITGATTIISDYLFLSSTLGSSISLTQPAQ